MNKMENMEIKQLVVSMSLPIIISMVIQALYNIVDSIFIFTYNLVNLYLVNSYLFNTLP